MQARGHAIDEGSVLCSCVFLDDKPAGCGCDVLDLIEQDGLAAATVGAKQHLAGRVPILAERFAGVGENFVAADNDRRVLPETWCERIPGLRSHPRSINRSKNPGDTARKDL